MPKVRRIRRTIFLQALVLIIGAAVCSTFFYRHVALNALQIVTEADNEVLAYESLRLLSPALSDYLAAGADVQSAPSIRPLPDTLRAPIARILERKDIREINIFDKAGKVVFTSDPRERVGNDHSTEPGLRTALAGKVANEFLYKNDFSRLDLDHAYDNLVQTYIPIARPGDARIVGVFELYSDINDVVAVLERTELLVMFGGLCGFSVLTLALFALFRRAGEMIESAQRDVEHDKRKLSWASLRVLRSEEKNREKLSADLQSGIIQTLSAVKLSVENAIVKAAKGRLPPNDPALDSITPVIQEIIGSLTSLAAELHPASLRDLGLLPALGRVCAEFQRSHRSIMVESSLQVRENDVPEDLKFTIYRAVQTVLENADRLSSHDNVKIQVAVKRRELALRIDLRRSGAADHAPSTAEQVGTLAGVEEAVILSRGTFTVSTERVGEVSILATWVIDLEQSVAADG